MLAETLTTTENPATQAAILKGMLSGLDGRRKVQDPEGGDELSSRFASSNDQRVHELSIQLSQVFGHRAATDQALAPVRNRSADVGRRRTALRSLLNQQNEEASELLRALQKKQIRREDISAQVARSLSDLLGPAFVEEYGDIRPIEENHASLIEKHKK